MNTRLELADCNLRAVLLLKVLPIVVDSFLNDFETASALDLAGS